MSEEQPYLSQPGVSEQLIVEAMLSNRESEHWKQCIEFVTRQVHLKAKNLPWDRQEEVIQEVMCRIFIHLPKFRFKCALKTWLFQIIGHCIVDEHRHLRHKERFHVPLIDPFTESDHESEELKTIAANFVSIEESFEKMEKMCNWVAALLDYANTHSHSKR